MSRTILLTATLTALCFGTGAEAAKVKVWQHNTQGQFDKAQLKGATVGSEGGLRLARRLTPLTGLDATHVWDLVETKDGTLYAATGDEGKLYKITPEGKASVVATADDSQILCLALAADGTVYAGTGPSGNILHVVDGKAELWYETGESYVWSLAVDPNSGAVYAGTGPHGKIHRVEKDGEGGVWYASKQEHVLCLACAADGTLYAGTDKNGLVYRITAKGKAFALFQAPQPEVRRIIVTPECLYVATSAPTNKKRGSASTSDSSPASGGVTDFALLKQQAEKVAESSEGTAAPAKGGSEGKESESKESKGSAASAPSAPGNGENSVYRLSFDGTVREVFREKALILSLLRLKGRFLVGTGMDGQLFEVDESSKEKTELARLDHGQILCMVKRKDGSIVLGTGDPGKLYVLSDRFSAKGTVTSEVLDAKLMSKWGSMTWVADVPASTSATIAVRSGNVVEPDETWSDWSDEMSDPEKAAIKAPPARFLQYRVTLKANADGTASPSVKAVTLRYATVNVAPEVTKTEVPDVNVVNLENPKKLKIKWNAQDANEDELSFSVYVRKDGWKNWVLLEDDLDKSDYEWDTTTTPSGTYQVKIVASDRKDNGEADALTGEKVSAPFVVCHTPPAVSVKVVGLEGDQAVVEATATSPLVRITSASFAINGKKWTNVAPTDGLFDSKTETFKFRTEGLKPGTYVLVLKVKDASGNTGSSDVVFTVQAKTAN
jgi:hypothetical protein